MNIIGTVKTGTGYFNFRCNICGDSKKKKVKKRGFILLNKKDNKWYFKCHNCGIGMSVEKWMKKYYNSFYKDYVKEVIKNKGNENNLQTETVIKNNIEVSKPKVESNEYSSFISINKPSRLQDTAIEFCIKRKIPETIWKKWFVCISGKYNNRLIIPFYDNKGKIYFFQARTLNGDGLKYINKVGEKEIYNIHNIDKRKPVILTEGPIDAMLINNCIAGLGLSLSEKMEKHISKLNCYFLFDNDIPGRMKSLDYLLQGKYVFLWSKFLVDLNKKGFDVDTGIFSTLTKNKIKDINDLYILLNLKEPIDFKDLKSYFSNSIFDRIYLNEVK